MESLGELKLAAHRFPIHQATFRRIMDNGQGNPGWEFNIRTQPPLPDPGNADKEPLFLHGLRFYAEGDPIPLPDTDDLTGIEVFMEESSDPESGDPYFTLYASEHGDVSHTRLQFIQRRGSQYSLRISALAHNIFDQPIPLEIETWITRLPNGRYGQ
jgi:hypothetical protein